MYSSCSPILVYISDLQECASEQGEGPSTDPAYCSVQTTINTDTVHAPVSFISVYFVFLFFILFIKHNGYIIGSHNMYSSNIFCYFSRKGRKMWKVMLNPI